MLQKMSLDELKAERAKLNIFNKRLQSEFKELTDES